MTDLLEKVSNPGGGGAATSTTSNLIAGGQLLVIVADINPNHSIFAGNRQDTMFKFLDSTISLCNAHLSLHPGNSVAVIAAHGAGCTYLYPDPEHTETPEDHASFAGGQFDGFYKVNQSVRRKAAQILLRETSPAAPIQVESLLSGALCMALTYVNRYQNDAGLTNRTATGAAPARILVISGSGDTASQYINYMNAFFSAQKMGVAIDTCMLIRDSGLLQQGADITGGIYRKVEQRHIDGLLQFLVWIFLPDQNLKESLSLPPVQRVDYRAACFCHRNLVDVGFVCSVCLSIFCRFSPICTTCHTVFKMGPVLAVPKKKAKLKNANSTTGGAAGSNSLLKKTK